MKSEVKDSRSTFVKQTKRLNSKPLPQSGMKSGMSNQTPVIEGGTQSGSSDLVGDAPGRRDESRDRIRLRDHSINACRMSFFLNKPVAVRCVDNHWHRGHELF